MEIEFDFREEQSRLFGPILRPVAEIVFVNGNKEILESVYVDSGADVSLMPKSVGDALGFTIEKSDNIIEIKGVGERGIPVVLKKLKMKIGETFIETRIAWALIEEVPLLLGRVDVFNFFDICFKKNKKTVFTN